MPSMKYDLIFEVNGFKVTLQSPNKQASYLPTSEDPYAISQIGDRKLTISSEEPEKKISLEDSPYNYKGKRN